MEKYELVIIWDDGDKEVIEYDNQKIAENAERGYKRVWDNHIQRSYIRPKRRI